MKSYRITEEQIKENQDLTLKEYFKEVFETKLEVGKWYKHNRDSDFIMNITEVLSNKIKTYGILHNDGWTLNWDIFKDSYFYNGLIPATKEEVEQALIKEANKRGFKSGVLCNNTNIHNNNIYSTNLSYRKPH